MNEEQLTVLLKYVKDRKIEAETLARDLDNQRANKAQKARNEQNPARKMRLIQEVEQLRRRCFKDPEETLRQLRARIAQELGLKETREIDVRATRATTDDLHGDAWARRVLGMGPAASP